MSDYPVKPRSGMVTAMALSLALGILMVVGGVGLLQRRGWARTLTLILAVVSLLIGVSGLIWWDLASLILNLVYAVLAFVLLLPGSAARDFAPAT
jgi:hypothetical protein